MASFPSVQEKVHAEIDRVVGSRRPPAFDDQAGMPYLHAVILETLRWNPVVPMGEPKLQGGLHAGTTTLIPSPY